ncbi:hypothetical protein A4G99_12520 [Haladaptatus sp. R4]|nr:hypothetical protein A4G99_12520 [Haladaptatus sp. R4]
MEQKVENAEIQGGRGNRRYAQHIHKTDDYLYFYFTKEVAEERQQFTEGEDGEDIVQVGDAYFARDMQFLLRDDGYYAFQSRQGVYGEDAIDHILHDTDIINLNCSRQETFPPEWMQSFYYNTHLIRKIKLKGIGENDTDGLDEEIIELVDGISEPTRLVQFSTSGRDNNLRGTTIIDALAEVSNLDKVSAKDAEGNVRKLSRQGRLTITYPDDLDHEGQAERIYNATEEILGNIN